MRAHSFALAIFCLAVGCTGGAPGEGGDAGQGGGGGGGESCDGVTCDAPPARRCQDAQTLRTYEPTGVCDRGECLYTAALLPCRDGCANDACVGDPCAGVSCTRPPANSCADATHLRSYSGSGTCSNGSCEYSSSTIACTDGCASGACVNDACAGISCQAPPAPSCLDANTRRSWQTPGSCAAGQCSYTPVSMTCQFGCSAGACTGDPCTGVSCATPPAAYCKDASTLKSFAATGTCAGGGCTYAITETPCAFGCAGAACKGDPCSGLSCTTPPGKLCVNGTTLRTYSATGSCTTGSCSYPYVDTVCPSGCSSGACSAVSCGGTPCNTPPAKSCTSTTRLRTYASLGTCSGGNSCSYQAIDIDCSNGCLNGACIAGSTLMEIPVFTPSGLIDDDYSQLAIGADGQPRYVVTTPDRNLVYREKGPTGWVETTIDSGIDDARSWKSMILGPTGEVYVAYYDTTNKDLRFAARAAGGTMFTLELITSTGDVGIAPAVTLDPTGHPVVGFVDGTQYKYRVATRGASSWTLEDVASGAFLGNRGVSQLLFDGAGKLHVVYGDRQDDHTSFTQPAVRYGFRSGTTWTVSDLAPMAIVARRSLGLTPGGKPYVLFMGLGNTIGGNRIWSDGVFGEQSAVYSMGNIPVAIYDWNGSDLKIALFSSNRRSIKQNGAWTQVLPAGVPETWVVDGARGPDGRMRLLTKFWQIHTLPACEATCTNRSCGSNGCGGACAPGCSAAQMCSPSGQCQ